MDNKDDSDDKSAKCEEEMVCWVFFEDETQSVSHFLTQPSNVIDTTPMMTASFLQKL